MYIKEDVPAQCYRAATKPQPQENTATVFLYYYTSMVSTLITAMCFEKVRKTTSNITAPFDEDENMHTRQPFFKKVCFCSFRHPLKYCNYCSLKMKIKKLIHFQD